MISLPLQDVANFDRSRCSMVCTNTLWTHLQTDELPELLACHRSSRYAYITVINTPVPQRFWLILHSSEARFISAGHLRKTIVLQSDESDLCLLTIRSVSDVFGVV